MRKGMTPKKTIRGLTSFQGIPGFISSFPTEHQQVVDSWGNVKNEVMLKEVHEPHTSAKAVRKQISAIEYHL